MKSEKINILHVSISDGAGGASIAANRLHQLMNKTSMFDSKMLVLIKNTFYLSINVVTPFQRNIARVGIYLDKLFTVGKKKGFGLFSVAPFGISISQNPLIINADIIYLHWINNGFLSLSEIKNILTLDKPIFLFCHDMWYFSGGCHQSYGCMKFQNECNNCHFFKSNYLIDQAKHLYRIKRKIYYEHSKKIRFILPSSLWFRMANSSALVPSDKTYLIPNILDEDTFHPRSGFLEISKHNKFRLLYGAIGGKSNEYKGWGYFVEAMIALPLNIREKLEIVLFGYDFTVEELRELPFPATSVGNIGNEADMVKLYQDAQIYVFPSLQESFGQTLMEAMSCGLPCVAFPVGAAEDLIDHLENGYLAKYKDAVDLAAGIMYVMDKSRYNILAENARKKIVTELSAKLIIESHFELIKEELLFNTKS